LISTPVLAAQSAPSGLLRELTWARLHGHAPSISTSSEKLSRMRMTTMAPSTATLSSVGSTTMVRTMSATIRTSSGGPSRETAL
jgi:hypothetical protein